MVGGQLKADAPGTFSLFMGGLLLVAVLAFWTPYFSRVLQISEPYLHIHVVLVSLWMAMLIGQPLLVRMKRIGTHRKVGRLSYVLAPAVAISALLLAHHRFGQMDSATFDKAAFSLYLGVMTTAIFAGCYATAIAWRRVTTVHAIFMLGTGLSLIDPIMARLLFFYTPAGEAGWIYDVASIILITFILLPLIILGDRGGKLRPAASVLLGVFGLFTAGWLTFARTDAWSAFAHWFVALPLT
jgi:hypothetical protein